MYYFSIWHVSQSRVNLAAVCRDYLGKCRASLGAQVHAEEVALCRWVREKWQLWPNPWQSQWSKAEVPEWPAGLGALRPGRDCISLYDSPYHWNSSVHFSWNNKKHFQMSPKGLQGRKLSYFPTLAVRWQGEDLIYVSLCPRVLHISGASVLHLLLELCGEARSV